MLNLYRSFYFKSHLITLFKFLLSGDIYLSTHTQVGNTPEETGLLLEEHNSFKEKARETREKVKLLLQLADTLVEKGHAHAPNIKQWVEEVDETYKNFSTRMDEYREKVLIFHTELF